MFINKTVSSRFFKKSAFVVLAIMYAVLPLYAGTQTSALSESTPVTAAAPDGKKLSSSALMSFPEIAKQTNSVLYWDALAGNGIFEKNGRFLSFSAHNSFVMLDCLEITPCSLPVKQGGTYYASRDFFDTVKNIFDTLPPEVHFRIGAILIDPGHGGQDPGAVADYTVNGKKQTLREKDVVLFTAKDLYNRLKEKYPDKKIMLTRSTDVFLTLNQRTDIANTVKLAEHEAILYVSLHANSAFYTKAKGFEVWYLSPGYRRTLIKSTGSDKDKDVRPILNSMMEEEFTTESILIAKYIQNGIKAQVGHLTTDRGLKEEEWFVVRNANMPSVLVELGFVTNEEEAMLLFDKDYLRKLSVGIYNGLTAFVTHFEESRGFTGGR